MADLVEVLSYINNALYLGLAVAAFRRWRRQGGEAAAWVAATFAALATIGLIGLVTPDQPEGLVGRLVQKFSILGVVFFPYGLYRFTSAVRRTSVLIDRIALGATLLVGVWTLFLGELPEPGNPRPVSFQIYIVALLVQWGGLLVTVAVRLWGAGKGQPTLARRRMRVLSLGSIGMTLALVIAGTRSGEVEGGAQLITPLLAMTSVTFFFLGFAPPAILRMAWRRPEQEALREATEHLVAATTPQEVTDTLLPHVTRTLGAQAAILVDREGRTLGAEGDIPAAEQDVAPVRTLTEETVHPDVLRLDFDFGSVMIWGSPYTPFFGQEEVELLRSLGVLTGLALDRTKLYRREQEARAAAESANQKLQEANAGLVESQARLAEAQSIAHIGSFTWEIATNHITWSAEMYELFGLSQDEVLIDSATYFELVHPDDRDFVDSAVRRAVEERSTGYSFDHRVARKDGAVRILHARGRVEVDANDQPVRVTGTAQDVTDAREAQRRIAAALASETEARRSVEELNAEMESFVYTVSHDLNSPIIAIQGFSDFLSKDFGESLPEKGRFYIERISASAGYLQSLIQDLLQFSRVGRTQTEAEDVSLQDIVAQAADEVAAGSPGLEVEATDLPVVSINPLRARQLFTNLMQNSSRYAGGPDVKIHVTAEPADRGLVAVSVRDNGPGIPEQYRKKVFGVFERLQQTGKTEGSGIGLPICKRIVETFGGTMWIADSADGLDVRFTIPLAEGHAEGER